MEWEILFSVCIGLGLAAACGFRVFVPLLVMSLAAHTGHLQLAGSFEWIGQLPAVIAFAVATALEIGAYYVPWLDNFLDGVAAPAAVVAGVMTTASVITDMEPFLKWTLAVIAGGGIAGTVHAFTAGVRGASTLTTAGFGNPLVSTVEAGTSVGLSLLAVVMPVIAFLFVIALALFAGRRLRRRRAPA